LAFFVRVVGPDFLNEDTQTAFARIESEMRQYSIHTRESLVLALNPFVLLEDHLVLLWNQGVALIALIPRGGEISVDTTRPWLSTDTERRNALESSFENPLPELLAEHQHLEKFITQSLHREAKSSTLTTASGASQIVESHPAQLCIKTIALFTLPVSRLRVEEGKEEPRFLAMTLDHAVSRTFYHQPNLLRAIEGQPGCFTNAELNVLAELLEKEAQKNAPARKKLREENAKSILRIRRASRKHSRTLIIAVTLVLVAVGLAFWIFSNGEDDADPQQSTGGGDTTTVVTQPEPNVQKRSTVYIKLSTEAQLFISRDQYQSRSELDWALSHGQGYRMLPATSHTLSLDSSIFAKGVYGYFKVDNEWRKGKLLQTFREQDTFNIDNFLPPLQ